jgi:hypothetical protein
VGYGEEEKKSQTSSCSSSGLIRLNALAREVGVIRVKGEMVTEVEPMDEMVKESAGSKKSKKNE